MVAAPQSTMDLDNNTWARIYSFTALVVIVILVNMVVFFGASRSSTFFNYHLAAQANWTETAAGTPSAEQHQSQSTSDALATTGDFSPGSSHSSPVQYFPVCVILTIGDDTGRADNSSLPFSLLYRLFDAAHAEVSKFVTGQITVNIDLPVKVMVGVDYPSVACKMARDSFLDFRDGVQRVELKCVTADDVRNTLVNTSGTDAIESSSSTIGCGMAIVGKSAQYVAQLSDVEWVQLIRWKNIRVIDLDEPDLSHNPPALPRELWRPTIITAFSSNHFKVGLLLLRSLAKSGMEAAAAGQYNISIVIYALEDFNSMLRGLLDCVVLELNEKYKIPTEVRQFNFSAYPSWITINQTANTNTTEAGTGEYAWKVIIIHSVLLERGFILWSDAGCLYNREGLVTTLDYSRDNGFANSKSWGDVPVLVHPDQIKYFRYQVRRGEVQNCNAAVIGLTLDKYRTLVRPWYDCSLTRQCIAPDGSDRSNHRQDQAALTLIADMSGSLCQGRSSNVYQTMDHSPANLSRSITTDCYRDPWQVHTVSEN